jgi:anti-sigma B factor antagonist
MDITVAEDPHAGVTVVTLHGELGVDSATALRTTLVGLIDRYAIHIVVDLASLTFCDSIGLSAFVDGHRRCAAAGGWLRLAAARPFLHRVLEVVGLLGPVPLYATVCAARTGDEAHLIQP